ncbi:pyridine nucleotide-disulfide oxidoreductase [Arthrobacter sp. Leaf234]|uniref:dihydrolipoyl dehydrogenase family protein n=1 Tax=Arthrobacter sp. Leaf234 TaxID=1736303 RepID=UPI0006F286CF|nr:NAD(P)/FAD-dependent oxidoreductase [Arthrobacter sp. Leaf234]KQO02834.1 pyridine nucleotide-disulfide oxidoreductase [Arthrobacter sp. Leaf234]
MSESKTTDVIIIGAGAVGENVAGRVVQKGLTAVLVESDLVGGECSYWACMPSKALLRPGTVLSAARAVAGAREAVTGTIDPQQVLARRTSFTSHWDDASQEEWVASAGITLERGWATVTGEREVSISHKDGSESRYRATHAVVLATGSTPTIPPIDGLADLDYWTTREATSAETVPASLAVLGGGVAGVELAQAYARLGAEVTVIARSGILGGYPAEASGLVLAALRGEGITVLTDTATNAVRTVDGMFVLDVGDGDTVTAERLLVSTGRHPHTTGLGLEELGLDPKKIRGDATGLVPDAGGWFYAVGDAGGRVQLTHQGKYEARMTGDAIAARAAGALGATAEDWSPYAATADDVAVPQVVFTDPEIAMVGRTLEQARKDGVNASETSLPIAVAGSSLHGDDYTGWAQIVVDEDRKVLVGVTFAGPEVSELLHSATIAVVGEVPLHRLWHAVPAYPTVSEVWLRLLEKYGM